jgi:pimeloyl-ACP methyl ester carboxylesterase
VTVSWARLQSQVKDLRFGLPTEKAGEKAPLVVLMHGLGGDRNDWTNPFQDRNWPYDHRRTPESLDMGVHGAPPIAKLPGIQTAYFLSPRLASNSRGQDGSDDRSWWHALTRAGFAVVTYSQVPKLMMPLTQGPVAEFKRFMESLRRDLLSDPGTRDRQVVILGHSRGGLIARAYLGDPEVKADKAGRFPGVRGLITLSSPHQGSQMALLDDRFLGFLQKLQEKLPNLPNDAGDHIINTLKAKINAFVGPYGNEIEPRSPLFQAMEAQEPPQARIRYLSVGGTSPRFLRIYLWTYTPDSLRPRKSSTGKLEFHWRAAPLEAKIASPIPDGLPLKLLGLELDEILPGRGDGLTADKRCRFPATFHSEEHLSVQLSHAEELWDPDLQRAVMARLSTFK